MSTAVASAAAPTTSGRRRRYRSSLVVVVGAVVAVVVITLGSSHTRTSDPLDPDNPSGDGAQALARVLSDQGVDVEIARSSQQLHELRVSPADTVLVTAPDLLGRSTASDLLTQSGGADLVVVGAGPGATDALGVDEAPDRVDLSAGRDADCSDPLLTGLRVQADVSEVYPGGDCFGGADGAVVSHPAVGLTLFGADQALTNDQVLRADNAAIALRLLGQRDRLVWYVPSLQDLGANDGVSVRSLIPHWIVPGLWLLGATVIVVALWRGRRMGALASEPLPVVVKAVETTRSRGRLYRRAGDRGHAADALRRATLRRCAERVGLGARIPPETVVQAVAQQSGRPLEGVAQLLLPGPPPATDNDLIHLAEDLATLEREVRRP